MINNADKIGRERQIPKNLNKDERSFASIIIIIVK